MSKNFLVEDIKNELTTMEVQEEDIYDHSNSVIDDYKLIRRVKDNIPIHIASKKFATMQLVDSFNEIHNQIEDFGIRYTIDEFVVDRENTKNRFKVEYKFPDISFDVDGSQTVASAHLMNSNDGTMRFMFMFGAFRLVCANGVIIGRTLFKGQKKHIGNMDSIKINIPQKFEQLTEQFSEFSTEIEKAQEIAIKEQMIDMLAKNGFPKKITEHINEKIHEYIHFYNEQINPATLWGLYATLSHYISHEVQQKNAFRAIQLSLILKKMFQENIQRYERSRF